MTVISFQEASEVGEFLTFNPESRTATYLATLDSFADNVDTQIEAYILANLGVTIPAARDDLVFSTYTAEQIMPKVVRVSLEYTPLGQITFNPPASGVVIGFNFDFGVEQKTLRHADGQQRYPATAPDRAGFINVDDRDSPPVVNGIQSTSPIQVFELGISAPYTFFTDAYLRQVEELVDTINDATFQTRAAGEVLFVGARGTIESTGSSSISFRFLRKKNPFTNPAPASSSIAGVDVEGATIYAWDQIDVGYRSAIDANDLVAEADRVYINRVKKLGDFSLLLIP